MMVELKIDFTISDLSDIDSGNEQHIAGEFKWFSGIWESENITDSSRHA